MKGWLLVLPFAAGCSPQYTREQAKNCAAAESAGTAFWGSVAEDSPTHTRETALAALPVLIDRLKSFPPGSAGADEEIKGLISSATDLQAKVPALSPTATKAWWTMWLLPIWGVAVSATIVRQGLVEGQAPPSPLFTGPLIAALSTALLMITVPRFFGQAALRASAEVPAP